MANQAPDLLGVERKARVLLLGALAVTFVAAGTVSKSERAVFLTEGSGLPAKAFAAMVPASDRTLHHAVEPLLAGFGHGRSRDDLSELASNRRRPDPRQGGPAFLGGVTDGGFAAPAAPLTTLGNAAPGGPSSAVDPASTGAPASVPSQFTPTVPQPSGGAPVGGGGTGTGTTTPTDTPTDTPTGTPTTTPTGTPTTTPTGTPTTTPTGSPTGTPTAPVDPDGPTAAVPEPATWAMLLLGFFAIGAATRRKRSLSAAPARG